MLYTEDFTMRHYVGFSQIGSHIFCQSNKTMPQQVDILISENQVLQILYHL